MKSILDISTNTQLCALIGDPIGHSLSPAIHNRAFQELGLDYVYLAFRVKDVSSAVAGMRALENFRGLSVTIPHKVSIINHLEEVNEVDRQIGSVNTVVNENGRLRGFGSDGPGARQALLDSGVSLDNQSVLLLGSGGAARAIAFDLAHHSSSLSLAILGIIPEELSLLVADLKNKTGVDVVGEELNPENLEKRIAGAGLLIHATPIGMHPKVDASLVPPTCLHRQLAVMDVVYNPYETRLIQDARKKDLVVVRGIEMFVNQAIFQFEAWTGEKAPREIMRKVVFDHLQGRSLTGHL
jgi:shikimate dehydrogenase